MSDRRRNDEGFTLTEVLVGAMVLVLGILGVVTLADVANTMSARADGRSGAVSVGRRIAEAARGLNTNQLTAAQIIPALKAAAPNMPDSTPQDAAWTVDQRGARFVISTTVCTVDDPADGTAAAALRDLTYCSQPTATNPPDLQPDDYRRVQVTVVNQRRPADSVRQTVAVPSGSTQSLPMITGLRMRQNNDSCATTCLPITSQSQSSAVFDLTTVNNPTSVNWLLDGRPIAGCPPVTAACTGAGNAFSFTWSLGLPVRDTTNGSVNFGQCVGGNFVIDGVHQIGAQTLDRNGGTGAVASLSVVVNRCAALPPRGFNATGRNGNGPVDVEWQENSEGDVVGYRVYRGTSATSRTPVCPSNISSGQVIAIDAVNECYDSSAPNYSSNSTLYYGVYAVDRDANGALREGAVSFMNVNTGNRPPSAPSNFTASRGSGGVTLSWTIPGNQDQDSGDRIDSFRIYRRSGGQTTTPGVTYRYDRELTTQLCSGNTCTWRDPSTPNSTTTYWVASVDTHLRDSALTTGRAL